MNIFQFVLVSLLASCPSDGSCNGFPLWFQLPPGAAVPWGVSPLQVLVALSLVDCLVASFNTIGPPALIWQRAQLADLVSIHKQSAADAC